ncbi:hypothetical protein RvY_13814 [Ramazzottius varieornatus]|uniref:Uncharacterized protein n=1 Tax=Ramazzottius varieornatus TaxID=947166 RepID=A0A1D1VP81_RAMVA|nr:hypothetical protein RvY_13814 [Ramazzottius varieornatus]
MDAVVALHTSRGRTIQPIGHRQAQGRRNRTVPGDFTDWTFGRSAERGSALVGTTSSRRFLYFLQLSHVRLGRGAGLVFHKFGVALTTASQQIVHSVLVGGGQHGEGSDTSSGWTSTVPAQDETFRLVTRPTTVIYLTPADDGAAQRTTSCQRQTIVTEASHTLQ